MLCYFIALVLYVALYWGGEQRIDADPKAQMIPTNVTKEKLLEATRHKCRVDFAKALFDAC